MVDTSSGKGFGRRRPLKRARSKLDGEVVETVAAQPRWSVASSTTASSRSGSVSDTGLLWRNMPDQSQAVDISSFAHGRQERASMQEPETEFSGDEEQSELAATFPETMLQQQHHGQAQPPTPGSQDPEEDIGLPALARAIGAPLTEANVGEINKHIMSAAKETAVKQEQQIDWTEAEQKRNDQYLSAATNGFEAKSYLGNCYRKWMRENQDNLHDFKHLAAAQTADEMRKEWAAIKLKEFKESKVKSKKWARIDTTMGEYKAFPKLVKDLGGWRCKESIDGAVKLAQKCLKMGKPWVIIHSQTEMIEFLHLKFQFEETFEQMWQCYRCDSQKSGADNEEPEDTTAGVGHTKKLPIVAAPAAKGKALAKNKAKAKHKLKAGKPAGAQTGAGAGGQAAQAQKEAADLAGSWASAKKLKVRWCNVESNAAKVAGLVGQQASWKFAEAEHLPTLQAMVNGLQKKGGSFVQGLLMASDESQFKKNYSKAEISVNLKSFVEMDEEVAAVEAKIYSMCQAHDFLKGDQKPNTQRKTQQ